MNTVKKITMAEVYENDQNKKFKHMGSTVWAVVNEKGQVVTMPCYEGRMEKLYGTKQVAQYEANK